MGEDLDMNATTAFSDIHDELTWRGAIYDTTAGAEDVLKTEIGRAHV